ncbi:MAG: nucleotidyltransferase family protein [Candidatus Poribacteria bacterium]
MELDTLYSKLNSYQSNLREVSAILEAMTKILRIDRTLEGIQDALKVLFSASSISVLKLLAKHKVGPAVLILSGSNKYWSSDPQGKALYNVLEKHYALSKRQYQIAKNAIQNVIELLNKGGIQPLVTRGISIADLVYPDPVMRLFSDIDLVVSSKEYLQAVDILSIFQKCDEIKCCTTFIINPDDKENSKIYIDLHGFCKTEHKDLSEKIIGRSYGSGTTDFYDRSKLADSPIGKIRTLSENDLLQYLCLHWTKHLIKGGANLIGLCDIAFLIYKYNEYLDWDEIVRQNDGNFLYPPLVFSSYWLGANVPNDILEKFKEKTTRTFQKRVEIEKNNFGSTTLGLTPPKYIPPLWASYDQKIASIFNPPFEYLENRGIIKSDTNLFYAYFCWFKFLMNTYLLKRTP